MKFIKLKDLLRFEIPPFLLGAFLSRIMEHEDEKGNKYFYTYTNFRESQAVVRTKFDLKNYANELVEKYNMFSGYPNWCIHQASFTNMELRFYVLNDSNLSKEMFYKALYKITMSSDWITSEYLDENKKCFIRGFMELRGSVDTTTKLIAQDYFYNNRLELKKAQILTDLMNLPLEYANFNARNLQPQFVSGENKRNAQFRINLFYYASTIGFINEYKATIFNNAYKNNGSKTKDNIIYFDINLPASKNNDIKFIKYLNFFTNNIYEKKLTHDIIKELRTELNFDSPLPSNKKKRNKTLIDLFDKISENQCALCGTTKTFENKTTGKQYFEIHHVISFHNDASLDNIANLVKLCPTCHDMLKKGRASKENQIKSIIKILHEHNEIFEFTSSYLGIDDINDLAEKIWSMLG